MHPSYYWLACDLATGSILDEVPGVKTNALPCLIGALSTATLEIPIPDLDLDWAVATEPRRTILVCIRHLDDQIMWGGFVTSREGGSGDSLSLSLTTLEGYFDRRYVVDATHKQIDDVLIARGLAQMTNQQGIGLAYQTVPGGTLRDRSYLASDDKTIYSALTELSNVENGPEWMIGLDWSPDRRRITKTFQAQKTLGVQSTTPNVFFDFPGTVKSYTLAEDHTSSNGANWVQCFGDGEGQLRAASAIYSDATELAAGAPRFELRETITGATVTATLDEHAAALRDLVSDGTSALTIDTDLASSPQYRSDWNLGDTVSVSIARSYRHPDGLDVNGRVVGFTFDPTLGGTLSPILHIGKTNGN